MNLSYLSPVSRNEFILPALTTNKVKFCPLRQLFSKEVTMNNISKVYAIPALLVFLLTTTSCGTVGGAAVGAGAGAAIGAGTGHGAKKGALIGTGIGAVAGAIYDITKD